MARNPQRKRPAKQNHKIVKYRRPLDIGVVFFGFILIYLIIMLSSFFNSKHIYGYEVKAGSLAMDTICTGIALREEKVFNSEESGYINYYAREGEKVSFSSRVYTVDANGSMAQALKDQAQGLSLSEEDYNVITSEIVNFNQNYSDLDFSSTYDFKYSIEASVLDLVSQSMLEEIDNALTEGNSSFSSYRAGGTGVVEYYIDGMEELTVDDLTAESFDEEAYERTELRSKEMISAGTPVYKLVTSETWTLTAPINDYIAEQLETKIQKNNEGHDTPVATYQKVRFLSDDEEVWPSVEVRTIGEQKYAVFTFINSMTRYANQRFLEFEIVLEDQAGLKIPVSAVIEKDFFILPEEALMKQHNENGDEQEGFMKVVYTEGGEDTEFVVPTIYYRADGYVYVDPNAADFGTSEKDFETGDYIVIPDSTERYQVGKTESLQGVYNINKGYTIFRQINILYENEEYCIVEEGTSYGLSVYDHIVLDGSTVNEDEVIY